VVGAKQTNKARVRVYTNKQAKVKCLVLCLSKGAKQTNQARRGFGAGVNIMVKKQRVRSKDNKLKLDIPYTTKQQPFVL